MTAQSNMVTEMEESLLTDGRLDRAGLDAIYLRYNHREFVHPDPLEFLYHYHDPLDREIVALVASSLAYGRVAQILRSVESALDRMESPSDFARSFSRDKISRAFSGFKHRFTTGDELASMIWAAGRIAERFGSLEGCFSMESSQGNEDTVTGICGFVDAITSEAGGDLMFLLPHPCRGSACKRLNLFLRWMVRSDEVDPGGWYNIEPFRLLVPLDVHMYRLCRSLGLTRRKQADMLATLEITAAFRDVCPEDPVKYDFALTRPGIRAGLDAGQQ